MQKNIAQIRVHKRRPIRSSEIRKSLNIKPLLLRFERSQLRWLGHVSRMPQERLPKQALHAKANGRRRPVGRTRTRWTDYIADLGWNRFGLRPSEMMEMMEDREVWRLHLELLPPQPSRKSGQWRKKKYGTLVRYAFFVRIRYVGTLFELKIPEFSHIATAVC